MGAARLPWRRCISLLDLVTVQLLDADLGDHLYEWPESGSPQGRGCRSAWILVKLCLRVEWHVAGIGGELVR